MGDLKLAFFAGVVCIEEKNQGPPCRGLF